MTTTITLTEGEYVLTESMMEKKYISISELARWIGKSRQTVHEWTTNGRLKLVDGKVPLATAARLVMENEMKKRAA